MSKIIDAIYEDGVFKPIQHVDVKEHEKVAIKVVPIDEWQERFNRIIKKPL
jgi:predicted DNA-binding antitoxin AbrB/MazE fold protein